MKNYLKSNHYHTPKHPRNEQPKPFALSNPFTYPLRCSFHSSIIHKPFTYPPPSHLRDPTFCYVNDSDGSQLKESFRYLDREKEKRKMSSLGTSKGILEIAKFGVYVTVPIVLMYSFANNTNNLQKFMGNVCINDTEIFFPFFLHVLALSLF